MRALCRDSNTRVLLYLRGLAGFISSVNMCLPNLGHLLEICLFIVLGNMCAAKLDLCRKKGSDGHEPVLRIWESGSSVKEEQPWRMQAIELSSGDSGK